MPWIYLLIAGIFEIGWPLGFKLSQNSNFKAIWIILACISMALSGFFLWTAQKTIPIGTAYAVWTGMGAVGTFLIGIFFFKDSTDWLRIASVTFIIIGIIGIKLAEH